MKIAIGTNFFGNYHRQTIAIDSLIKIKSKYKNNVDLFGIQFKEEKEEIEKRSDINYIFELTRSSRDLFSNDKKLPYINDILNILFGLSYEYFIFTNSDVILSDRLINFILNNNIQAMPCSRLDIQNITTLSDTISPVRWEIAGFDTFIFSKNWFNKHRDKFHDYFIGKPYFDLAYASIIKIHSDDLIGNKNPAFCFHIHHGIGSVTEQSLIKDFNRQTYLKYDQISSNILSYYIRNFLFKRSPDGLFLNEISNEQEIEKEYFKQFKYE